MVAASLHVPLPDVPPPPPLDEKLPSWDRMGFPLLVFSNSELVKQEWGRVPGKRAHQDMLLLPYASLQHLDQMNSADGFLACTSNQVLFVVGGGRGRGVRHNQCLFASFSLSQSMSF